MFFDNARQARLLLEQLRDQIARERQFISDPRLEAAQHSLETALSEIVEAECALREEHYRRRGSMFNTRQQSDPYVLMPSTRRPPSAAAHNAP